MGTSDHITPTSWPRQGPYVTKRVQVLFGDGHAIAGTIVRDDLEPPHRMIFALADGRFVTDGECNWSEATDPRAEATHEEWMRARVGELTADVEILKQQMRGVLGDTADHETALNAALEAAKVWEARALAAEKSLAEADDIITKGRAQFAEMMELAEAALFECAETSETARKALDKIQPVAIQLCPDVLHKRVSAEEIMMRPGHTFIAMKAPHWAVSMIAESLVDSMKESKNVLELKASMETGDFTITVQRRHGKTPMDLRNEALARAEKAEKAQADLVEIVATAKRGKALGMSLESIGVAAIGLLVEKGWLS